MSKTSATMSFNRVPSLRPAVAVTDRSCDRSIEDVIGRGLVVAYLRPQRRTRVDNPGEKDVNALVLAVWQPMVTMLIADVAR